MNPLKLKTYSILFVLIVLTACNNEANNSNSQNSNNQDSVITTIDTIQDTTQTLPDSLLLEDSSPKLTGAIQKDPVQSFRLSPNKQNIIKGQEGSIFILPKNTFVDKNGQAINTTVELKLIEAYSLEDMIKHELETRTTDGLLITAGMFKLTAKTTEGEEVFIDQQNPIRVKVAAPSFSYQLFEQEDNHWIKPQQPSSYLNYLPVEKAKAANCIYLRNNKSYQNSIADLIKKLPEDIQVIAHKSYLSSREFERRFQVIGCTEEGYVVPKRIYLENIGKPLWIADSLVLEYYKELNGDFGLKHAKIFTKFKNEYKTTLNPEWALSKEEQNMLSKYEEKILAVYKKRTLLKKQEQINTQINTQISQFVLNTFGWCNIDDFYDFNRFVKTTINLKTNIKIKYIFLIFKDFPCIIRATEKDLFQYTFESSKDKNSISLPLVPVYLIAIAEEKGAFFFAKKELTLKKENLIQLDLKATSLENYKRQIKDITRGHAN
jgi:hypothetical protein